MLTGVNKMPDNVIQKYEILKDRVFYPKYGVVSLIIKEGETCEYFAHNDCYCFDARKGVVPFYDRVFVELRTDLFKPIGV